jgi:hypothetical protein
MVEMVVPAVWPSSQLNIHFVQCVPSHTHRKCYIHLVLRAMPALRGQRMLKSFLGRRPTILMLCLDNTLLIWLQVVPTKGKTPPKSDPLYIVVGLS